MNKQISKITQQALDEDIGTGDVSASLLPDKNINAMIVVSEFAVICGIDYAQTAFMLMDKNIKIDWKIADGDCVAKNQILCTLNGSSRGIISAERVALNFLQTLSATATQTRFLVDKIKHTKTQLLDTRKTLPNLRLAQKYAVKCGGGVNHRMGLDDCIMLKENHIIAVGSIKNAVKIAVKKYPDLPLIVEVENLSQLKEALALSGISRILCDNFSSAKLVQAVQINSGKIPLEASGNINKDNIIKFAETGVDYISIGAISKNIRAIDLSLNFV